MINPTYFVVYDFCVVRNDFIPVGIYTKKEDAAAHDNTLQGYSHAVVERTHEELCHSLAQQFLGALAEPLKALLCSTKLSADVDVDPFKRVYSRHEMHPAAVAIVSKEAQR